MRTLRIGVSFRGVRYLSIPRMSATAQGADKEVASHGPQAVPSKAEIIAGASREPRERLAVELAADEGEILDRLRRRVEAEGDRRTELNDLARLRHRALLADPHLRAVQRARFWTSRNSSPPAQARPRHPRGASTR